MIKCYSVLEALREIRELTKDLSYHNKVFLVVDYWADTFYVAEDEDEISDLIVRDFYDNCCDSTPERVASEWKVIEYCNAERKENLPYSYKKAAKPKFKNKVELLRRYRNIEPKHSVHFNIS